MLTLEKPRTIATASPITNGMNGCEGANVHGKMGADTGFIKLIPMMGGGSSWEILLPVDDEDKDEGEEKPAQQN